jgi:hypothetical protein
MLLNKIINIGENKYEIFIFIFLQPFPKLFLQYEFSKIS